MKNFFDKIKTYAETNTGKAVIGVILMIIAGIITAKIVNKTEE